LENRKKSTDALKSRAVSPIATGTAGTWIFSNYRMGKMKIEIRALILDLGFKQGF
jgi:hypothetical protein